MNIPYNEEVAERALHSIEVSAARHPQTLTQPMVQMKKDAAVTPSP